MAPWTQGKPTEYQLGIMSSKWSIMALSADIAVATIMLHAQTDAPIALYSPMNAQSKFTFKDKYTVEELSTYLEEHTEEIRTAYKTLKQIL